jgi:hypothetical protein
MTCDNFVVFWVAAPCSVAVGYQWSNTEDGDNTGLRKVGIEPHHYTCHNPENHELYFKSRNNDLQTLSVHSTGLHLSLSLSLSLE